MAEEGDPVDHYPQGPLPSRGRSEPTRRHLTCGAGWRSSRWERGSATVEFVIAAPLLAAVLLLVAGLGRIAEARGQVEGAAREAARTASLQPAPAGAAAA